VYDGGTYGAIERVNDHVPSPPEHQVRQRLWRIVAKRCVVAAGALERPIVFAGNDAPGVMMASAMRSYIARYAAAPAKRIALFTNNEDGWRTVETALGAVGLTSYHRGRPKWRNDIAAFVPDGAPPGMVAAGAANGAFGLGACLREGFAAGVTAARDAGHGNGSGSTPVADDEAFSLTPLWHVAGKGKAFVDQQHDVTASDIELAQREGFESVEHLKRYTTLGMATDQGKTSNVAGLAIMAAVTGKSIPETGTTIY
ncbi:MAG: sarcosine oxidase subunit alpha, partial [Mesorhizobium sp.]